LWGLIDLVPGQKYHAEVVAQASPRGVVGSSLWHEHSHHMLIAETSKALAVAQDLAEAEPELLFFVVVSDALDLGDEDCSFCLPGKIEVWLPRVPGPRFNTGLSQRPSQLVLSVGVPPEAALNKSWINCERLSLGRQRAYLGLSVCDAKRWCRGVTLLVCAW
jgi:hypothetical protein